MAVGCCRGGVRGRPTLSQSVEEGDVTRRTERGQAGERRTRELAARRTRGGGKRRAGSTRRGALRLRELLKGCVGRVRAAWGEKQPLGGACEIAGGGRVSEVRELRLKEDSTGDLVTRTRGKADQNRMVGKGMLWE